MFFTAHLAAGLIIGKLTGQYVAALLGMLLLDLDHLFVYLKEGVFKSCKKLWKIVSFQDYIEGDRTFLHSFIFWLPLSIAVIWISPDWGLAFSLGYFFHLVMDMFDDSDFYGFWPLDISFKGPIGYLSWSEVFLTVVMLIVWISI